MERDRAILCKAAERIRDSLIEAARILPPEVEALIEGTDTEGGKSSAVMEAVRKNLRIARSTGLPMCQDTGVFWCLASVGRDSRVPLADIERAVNEGAAMAASDGFYRRSVVEDPIYSRHNTGTNLPVFIFYELADGCDVEVSFLLKGFGSENCSSVRMLNPTAGEDGVAEAVVDMMKAAGGKPCPPVFLGVGVGGTMDRAAFLSKKAFFRPSEYPELARRILRAVNELGIGPGGLGGNPTALGVSILSEPTHIAGLPVALTVNCWAERRATVIFREGEL